MARITLPELNQLLTSFKFGADATVANTKKSVYRRAEFTGENKPSSYAADQEYTSLLKVGPVLDDVIDGVAALEQQLKDIHRYIEGQLGREGQVVDLPPTLQLKLDDGRVIDAIAFDGDTVVAKISTISAPGGTLNVASGLAVNSNNIVDAQGNWVGSATGLTGPKGATGAQGPQGPAGTNGSNGAKGATGAQGPQGPAGTNGSNGAKGATGEQGLQGAGYVGATLEGVNLVLENDRFGTINVGRVYGNQGAQGPQGPAGTNGSNGAKGATGAQGPQGPAGTNGSNGAKGATGAQGPQGPAGTNGSNGAKGATGSQGASIVGASLEDVNLIIEGEAFGTINVGRVYGNTGSKGEPGANGSNGTPGTNGTPGSNGSKGEPGANGSNGTPGTNGTPGPTGPTGLTGPAGPTGAKGEPGEGGGSEGTFYTPTFTGLEEGFFESASDILSIPITDVGYYQISYSIHIKSLYANRSTIGITMKGPDGPLEVSSNHQYFRYSSYGSQNTLSASFYYQHRLEEPTDLVLATYILDGAGPWQIDSPSNVGMSGVWVHRIS